MTGLLGDPSIATASLIDATLYCTLNGICSFPSRKRKRAQSPRRMTASYFPARLLFRVMMSTPASTSDDPPICSSEILSFRTRYAM